MPIKSGSSCSQAIWTHENDGLDVIAGLAGGSGGAINQSDQSFLIAIHAKLIFTVSTIVPEKEPRQAIRSGIARVAANISTAITLTP
jgi:hypothetical protein